MWSVFTFKQDKNLEDQAIHSKTKVNLFHSKGKKLKVHLKPETYSLHQSFLKRIVRDQELLKLSSCQIATINTHLMEEIPC